MYENTKKLGTDQVNNLLNTRVGQVVTSGVDMALTASDYAIEYYLPPNEEEKLEDEDDEDEDEIPPEKELALTPTDVSIKKMSKVSNKLRKRLYTRALKNIQYAQKRSQETVEKLQFTVNLVRMIMLLSFFLSSLRKKTNLDFPWQGCTPVTSGSLDQCTDYGAIKTGVLKAELCWELDIDKVW